jgi:hypothetical protein
VARVGPGHDATAWDALRDKIHGPSRLEVIVLPMPQAHLDRDVGEIKTPRADGRYPIIGEAVGSLHHRLAQCPFEGSPRAALSQDPHVGLRCRVFAQQALGVANALE